MTENETKLRVALAQAIDALAQVDRYAWLHALAKGADETALCTVLDACRTALRTAIAAYHD